MDGEIVASGTLPSYTFESTKYGEELVHRIKVTGPIDLKKRITLYNETLKLSMSTNYYCILDNRDGHENIFSLSDMEVLDLILVDAGITAFFGATITTDNSYAILVKLADNSFKKSNLEGELISTVSSDEAEKFIAAKLC